MDIKIREKLIKRLTKGKLNIKDASDILVIKSKRNLTKLMDTINYMYSNYEVFTLSVDDERYLILS